jgi:biotin synthase
VRVRVAFGTGAVLGLWDGRVDVQPTTAHMLTYYDGRCQANCKFCPQARSSTTDLKMLSRVVWPVYEFERVLQALSLNHGKFQRACLQSVNYPRLMDDLCELVRRITDISPLPVSLSCHPLTDVEMQRLRSAGVERLCIPLDASTPEIFSEVKGGYDWATHLEALERAKEIFDGVTTHLIIGLGETEEETVKAIQMLADKGVEVGLFAFIAIPGTGLADAAQPDLRSYRRIQLVRYLISKGLAIFSDMKFESGRIVDFGVERSVIDRAVDSGDPFRTSGCPGCNRPFYNESPRGPIYNYPRRPTRREIQTIREMFGLT